MANSPDATGKHLHATHTGSDSPNTKHTLEHGVKNVFKDKISSAVALCLFRYALPLAAFVVDAALLVGSMIFVVPAVPLYHWGMRHRTRQHEKQQMFAVQQQC